MIQFKIKKIMVEKVGCLTHPTFRSILKIFAPGIQ